jgi:hypothetical protein
MRPGKDAKSGGWVGGARSGELVQIGSKPVLCATRLRRSAHSSLPAFALRAQAGKKKLIPTVSITNISKVVQSCPFFEMPNGKGLAGPDYSDSRGVQ